jgi:hypothetical protein
VKNREGDVPGLFKNIRLEKRRKTLDTESGQPVPRLKFNGGVRTEFINNLSEKVTFALFKTNINLLKPSGNFTYDRV